MPSALCPSEQELQAFQLGLLSENALDQMADHLEECPQCAAAVQRYDSCSDALLAAIRDASPPARDASSLVGNPPSPTLPIRQSATSVARFSFLLPPAQPDELGRFGNYRVLRLIGAGGMAYVFHAEDIALNRPVALKIAKPELHIDAERLQRFIREARMVARIKHENLVAVYQAGQEGGVLYLAMELLTGEGLDSWLNRQDRPSLADILRLGREIAAGLAVVHQHGLIHRDIKPANIWLEAPGQHVRILDFGLARAVDDDANLTVEGAVIGTPAYMSPEQASGAKVDVRSDLFSLGCVLYRMGAGVKPFQAENTLAALSALAVQVPAALHDRNPSLPRPLSDLVMQLLAKAPEDRPPSAAVVLQRLEQIEQGLASSVAGEPTVANPPVDAPPAAPTPPTKAAPSRRRWLTVGASLGFAVIAVLAIQQLLGPAAWFSPPSSESTPPEADWPDPPPGSVFLKDLEPVEIENWPFTPPGKSAEAWASVIMDGKVSPKGIHMHPPPPILSEGNPAASLTYLLDKGFRSFHALTGLNDGPLQSHAPMTFSVYGDGKRLWQSRPVRTRDDSQPVNVGVEGVRILKIEVAIPETGKPIGAHAIWIEPHLVK